MTERATPNYSDAERELRRVEEIESAKMQDRTRAIVEAAERLADYDDQNGIRALLRPRHELEPFLDLYDAVRIPSSPPVPESKLRAVYEAAERLVARNAEGGSLVEAWEALEASLALRAEPSPAWTITPPSEPGWYWSRVVIPSQSWIGPPTPREWAPGDWTIDGERLRQFWPVPIQPPEET